MGLISFDQSGSGAVAVGQLTLAEVQELCCDDVRMGGCLLGGGGRRLWGRLWGWMVSGGLR